jgi:DNA-binding NarL/FixJ family response regulator
VPDRKWPLERSRADHHHKQFPEIPILMVTIHLSKQLAEEARRVGIRGACAKSDVGSIVEAVDALLHAGTYFPSMSSTGN